MAILPKSLQAKLDAADAKVADLTDEEIDAKLPPLTRKLFQILEGRKAPPKPANSNAITPQDAMDVLSGGQGQAVGMGWALGSGLLLIGMGWAMGRMLVDVDTFGATWMLTTTGFTLATVALATLGLRKGLPLPYLGAVIALLVASAQGAGDVHVAASGLVFLAVAIVSMLFARRGTQDSQTAPSAVLDAAATDANGTAPALAMPTSPLAPATATAAGNSAATDDSTPSETSHQDKA